MSDPNRSMSEVPALLEERRRYEAWLATLESRRESTPQHVFDRVKADYSARLQRVDEQLALHRHSIQEERTSLNSRRSLLEAEEQLRRDERFELELRSHVGEFAGSEAEAAFQAVDEALAALEAHDVRKAQLVKLRYFAGLTLEEAAAALPDVLRDPVPLAGDEPLAGVPDPMACLGAGGHRPDQAGDQYKKGCCILLSTAPCSQQRFYFAEGRSSLMEPSLIPSLAFWIWAFRSAGILLSQAWKGASPTPPFCRVPVLMPAWTEPSATVFR